MKNFEAKVFSNLLLFALSATIAGAQIADKKVLTLAGARRVISAAEAEAKKLNAPGGVIAVVDDGGNLMALERLDATFSAGANISIGKARTAVMFKKPTRFFEELINASGKGRTVMTAVKDFTPLIGGIPITVEDQIVGGVGVSGAASAQQDEALAIAGAAAAKDFGMKPTASMSGPSVTYFDKNQVTAADLHGRTMVNIVSGEAFHIYVNYSSKSP